jgi:hypothetical protein
MKKLKSILMLTVVSFVLKAAAVEPEQIHGTWRLVSATSKVVATGETTNVWGTEFTGFLTYGKDGRMSALIVFGTRPKPPDLTKVTDHERVQLYRSMLAYAGTYSLKGSTVFHHVEASSNETWTGTDLVRYAKIEGETLVITTATQPRSIDGLVSVGELKWTRVKASSPAKSR